MSKEIEVKVLEIDKQAIENRLHELGAQLLGDWLMKMVVYDFPDGRLLQKGAYLRIREEGERVYCTLKIPLSRGKYAKEMEEHEVEINDVAEMEKILLGLGMQRRLYLEKKRLHYTLGESFIEIDTLPGLPPLLEVEASSQAQVEKMLDTLKIAPERANSMGAHQVLAHYGKDLDSLAEIRFGSDGPVYVSKGN